MKVNKMNEFKQFIESNKIVVVIILCGFIVIGVAAFSKVLVDKTADRVIEKLQREYAPGPFHPGFDPDKVNPNWNQHNSDKANQNWNHKVNR